MGKLKPLLRRSGFSGFILIGFCWATAFLGPLSQLIIPALIIGLAISIRRKSWLILVLLVILNPLCIYFADGVLDYFRGAPEINFVGLPRLESYNLDRTSRCFKNGGGCLVMGHEWVFLTPHNKAVRLMSSLFGAPSKSYDGPYPTKEEGLEIVADAPETPVSEFKQGKIHTDSEIVQLQQDVITRLANRFVYISFGIHELDDPVIRIQARLHKDRCLILRLTEMSNIAENNDDAMQDILIFIDNNNRRPFAYFRIQGSSIPRFPPVRYLPEQDF